MKCQYFGFYMFDEMFSINYTCVKLCMCVFFFLVYKLVIRSLTSFLELGFYYVLMLCSNSLDFNFPEVVM